MNGIPRPFAPNNLAQKVADLERKVELLTSGRTYVNLERITVTEGGTIDSGVGDKLTETVKDKLVVGSENIGEGALNDKKIVGSSVRSEGVARAEYGDGAVRESNVSATLEQRVTPWSVGAKDTWPGLWLEGEPVDEPGFVPPELPAGVTLGDAWGGVLAARSSRATEAAAYGEVFVAPGQVSINSYSPAVDFHRAQTQLYVGMGQFHLASTDAAGNVGAEVRHSGDGILRLKALNGVLVNGQPIGSGGGSTTPTRWQPGLNAGWTQWTGASWNGIWIEQLGKLTIISGAVGKGSWTSGETIAALPLQYRPANKVSGNNCEVQANGNLNIGAAGTGASALSITYFSA